MKLTSITARNFKGQDFELNLSAINFIVGANFEGKTARTDAIRFLLLGYLPELGKLPRESFGLASGRDMEVSGEFDNGLRMRRRFYLSGDTIKRDEEIPEELGKLGSLAVMLNAEEYFSLSDRQRVEYVFANVPMPEITFVIPEVIRKQYDIAREDRELPVQESIELAITVAADCVKNFKGMAGQMEKTVQGLTHLRLADEEAGLSLAQLDAHYEQYQLDKAALQKQANALAVKNETVKTARARRKVIEANLAEGAHASDGIEELNHDLVKVGEKLLKYPESVDAKLTENSQLLGNLSADIRSLTKESSARSATILSLQIKVDQMDTLKTCPYCGAAGEGWKVLKLAEYQTEINQARKDFAELEGQIKAFEKGKTAAEIFRENLLDVSRTRKNLQDYGREILQGLNHMQSVTSKLEAQRTELAGLTPDDPDLQAQVDAVTSKLRIIETNLKDCDQKRRAAMGRAGDLKRLAEAEAVRDSSKKFQELSSAALEDLRVYQANLVTEAFNPLLEMANKFFGHVLKTPLAYNPRTTEIGTWRDGVWVGHRTFSGTEKALTYAAIQAALTSKSPVRIMLIDELARLDDDNAGMLTEGIAEAIEDGRIDQFVGIDTGRGAFYAGVLGKLGESSSQIVTV